MRTAVDYENHVQECRRLAKLASKPQDWAHFQEMAETWEMLLKHQREKQERVRQQAVALADRLQNVLFLSDDVAVNNNEEAA